MLPEEGYSGESKTVVWGSGSLIPGTTDYLTENVEEPAFIPGSCRLLYLRFGVLPIQYLLWIYSPYYSFLNSAFRVYRLV